MMSLLTRCCAALALALTLATAQAGRTCEHKPLTPAAMERGLALAERVARHLDASGAEVAVLARAGQDLSRYGLRYSHLGFVVREAPPGPGNVPGTWRVVHKLNQCGTARAALYRQGLAEFFLDDLHDWEAGIVPLRPHAQARLAEVLRDPRRVAVLHTRAYSMVAYPWAQRYQQSNQWTIETLAHAMDPAVDTRARAQAWLTLQGYQPTTLRLSTLTRLGARITAAHVAFDDHPDEKRFASRIETVTVDSVFQWLARSGLGQPAELVR
jgi:hypothetical protein